MDRVDLRLIGMFVVVVISGLTGVLVSSLLVEVWTGIRRRRRARRTAARPFTRVIR